MKQYVSRASLAVAIALIALSLVVAVMSVTAVQGTAAGGALNSHNQSNPELYARRIISPTLKFGINSPLELSEDGRTILVTGHGECPEGSQTFRIDVKVTQNSTRARAEGQTRGNCAATIQWRAQASASGSTAFEEGSALVCAQVIIRTEDGDELIKRWCAEVVLE